MIPGTWNLKRQIFTYFAIIFKSKGFDYATKRRVKNDENRFEVQKYSASKIFIFISILWEIC